MRRILVGVWGKDASKYVGRSLTLFRDPAVAFGGLQVGGIRVSHMSHITEDKTVALMVTRGRKAPFKIKPLKQAQQQAEPEGDAFGLTPPPSPTMRQKAEEWTEQYVGNVKQRDNLDDLIALQTEAATGLAKLQTEFPDLHELTVNAGSKRAAELQSEGVEG